MTVAGFVIFIHYILSHFWHLQKPKK